MNRGKAKKIRNVIEQASSFLADDVALTAPELFPVWVFPYAYQHGDRLRYNDELYKVLQAHTSQEDWTPDTAVSLYVRVDDPSIEWPEWVQPLGAQDAYNEGDKVSHNDRHWVSTADSNVWEPGIYGWEEQR